MKRPRGKQPTKPNIEKALLTRNLELKGSDKASFTIPIIYRRTFEWKSPNIDFVPLNRRSFVIFRGDLEQEESDRTMYGKFNLNVENLPKYSRDRVKKHTKDVIIELKEAILAASLNDRYVNITIPKPTNKKLYECLKEDMEELVGELGFEYSTDYKGIHCTFKFPKREMDYYAMESKSTVEKTITSLNWFRNLISQKKFEGASNSSEELLYNINRLELLMGRYYSDSLNIIWDLPNITCPGYFQWINSCELIMDEFLYIANETHAAINIVKIEDIIKIGKHRDIFSYVWDKALETCLEFCESAVSTVDLEPDDECLEKAFSILYEFDIHRKKVSSSQSRLIKLFTDSISSIKGTDRIQRLQSASYHLNNIFQATERIIVFSTHIARTTLKIGMYRRVDF